MEAEDAVADGEHREDEHLAVGFADVLGQEGGGFGGVRERAKSKNASVAAPVYFGDRPRFSHRHCLTTVDQVRTECE